jgi:hypothetical protein
MTRDRRLPVLAIGLAVAAGAVTLWEAPEPWRPAVVLVFLAIGPGMALVGLLGLDDPLEEVLLVVGASLVLDLLVAEALVLSSAWSAEACTQLLMTVAIGGAIAHIRLVPRGEP